MSFSTVLISTADYCSVGCSFCFRADRGNKTLNLANYMRMLSIAREMGMEGVCLTGGEPTDHPRFRDLLRGAAQFGIPCSVVTAASSQRRIESIVESQSIINNLTISADSVRVQELGRTGRNLTTYRDLLLGLISWDKVSIHLLYYDLSNSELETWIKFFEEFRVRVAISPLLLTGRELKMYGIENSRYQEQLQQDSEMLRECFDLTNRLVDYLVQLKEECRSEPPTRLCASTKLYMSASGMLRACPYDVEGGTHVQGRRSHVIERLNTLSGSHVTNELRCKGICN